MTSTTRPTPKGPISEPRTTKFPTARKRTLTHDDIAVLAHALYVRSGHQPGREVEFWLEAERQLRDDLDV